MTGKGKTQCCVFGWKLKDIILCLYRHNTVSLKDTLLCRGHILSLLYRYCTVVGRVAALCP